jgi:hypothetical protein
VIRDAEDVFLKVDGGMVHGEEQCGWKRRQKFGG